MWGGGRSLSGRAGRKEGKYVGKDGGSEVPQPVAAASGRERGHTSCPSYGGANNLGAMGTK